jgi:hypothetical protein
VSRSRAGRPFKRPRRGSARRTGARSPGPTRRPARRAP